jgi:hypothetical protein
MEVIPTVLIGVHCMFSPAPKLPANCKPAPKVRGHISPGHRPGLEFRTGVRAESPFHPLNSKHTAHGIRHRIAREAFHTWSPNFPSNCNQPRRLSYLVSQTSPRTAVQHRRCVDISAQAIGLGYSSDPVSGLKARSPLNSKHAAHRISTPYRSRSLRYLVAQTSPQTADQHRRCVVISAQAIGLGHSPIPCQG